jgi:hypothetical protein
LKNGSFSVPEKSITASPKSRQPRPGIAIARAGWASRKRRASGLSPNHGFRAAREWQRARDAGLDSIWIHDSYFERDAVTYGPAIAGALSTIPRARSGWPWAR